MHKKRLFMISNRLPVTIDSSGPDPRIINTSGGLITAINSFLRRNKSLTDHFSHSYWVGVPECTPATWSKAESLLPAATFEYLPVFINKNIFEEFQKENIEFAYPTQRIYLDNGDKVIGRKSREGAYSKSN